MNLSEHFNWSALFEFEFGKIFINRVKQYNFKFLHRILPFKENLVQWKITSDMTCKHCKGIETVVHALLYCPEVALFWQKVRHFINFNYNIDLTIDEKML